jgi:hypothetical protein
MTVRVDLLVLGTGAAAQSAAFPCREAGWSVLVVDSDRFGGTCALRGCDPKKVLVGVAELIDWARRMHGKGPSGPAPALEWPQMIRFKRTFTDGVPAAMDQSFKDAGMLTVHGRARFAGPASLRAGDETYAGKHVVRRRGPARAPGDRRRGAPDDQHRLLGARRATPPGRLRRRRVHRLRVRPRRGACRRGGDGSPSRRTAAGGFRPQRPRHRPRPHHRRRATTGSASMPSSKSPVTMTAATSSLINDHAEVRRNPRSGRVRSSHLAVTWGNRR